MENRRLQRTGGASLTVTLPKKWVDQYSLQEKDRVLIYTQTSGALLIKTLPVASFARPARLHLMGLTLDMITREAIALYIAGVEEIEMHHASLTPRQRAHIRRLTQMFMGFEIIDESAAQVTLRNILDVSKLTIPDTIDKMFTATRSMFNDAMMATINNLETTAQDIADRDLEIDKLYLVIKRQFHSALDDYLSEEELNLTRSDLNYYRTVALQLERIADHAVKIAHSTPTGSAALSPATQAAYKNLLQHLLNVMDDAFAVVHKSDRSVAHHILDQNATLEAAIAELQEPSSTTATRVLLNDSLDRVRGYLINTAETIIDHAIRQQISKRD